MNQLVILALILVIVAMVFVVCMLIFPLLRKKGVDTEKVLDKTDKGLEIADNAVDAVKTLAPATPYISVIDKIIEYAQVAVKKAEQLYKANQGGTDTRKTEAVQLVKDCLTAAKIDITPDIEKIIDGAVESAVYALPKTHTA